MEIKLENGRIIGGESRCFIIAEGCDNHMGNLSTAKEMALQAKLAGADAIKFQHHLPDEEMLRDAPMSANFSEPLYEFLTKHALTLDQHCDLKQYCRKLEIMYMCTPFSYKAAEEIVGIGLDLIKIGSGEMTDIPCLVKMATKLKKPMIVSTGMATFEEIDETYRALTATGIPLALTNCVSEYPPIWEDINLGVISLMKQRYPAAVVGHSDHTPDIYTCFAALTLGAKIIEKHVILDKRQPGPDQSVSIDFRELAQLVDGIRKIEAAMGERKAVHSREKDVRRWAFRSIVALRPIHPGETITQDMVWSKRPGTGIPSKHMAHVIGRNAIRPIAANTLISWADLDGMSLA